MKKSIIFTIIISIIITIIIGIILTKDSKKEESSTYIYDYLCTYDSNMNDDEGSTDIKITNNLYLIVDSEDYVTNAIYEKIYQNEYFSQTTRKLTQEILDIYNEVDGVETSISTKSKKTYIVIKYDYNKINFKEMKKSLKSVLDSESLQFKMNDKLKVEDYIKESSDYSCIKK